MANYATTELRESAPRKTKTPRKDFISEEAWQTREVKKGIKEKLRDLDGRETSDYVLLSRALLRDEFRQKAKELRKLLRRDKKKFIDDLAKEAARCDTPSARHEIYGKIRCFRGGSGKKGQQHTRPQLPC